ncbi:MAG: hypothetical protein IJV31_07310 [Clostridia bacterium]|nr:hypothetical protein [Clostridia bacterium]
MNVLSQIETVNIIVLKDGLLTRCENVYFEIKYVNDGLVDTMNCTYIFGQTDILTSSYEKITSLKCGLKEHYYGNNCTDSLFLNLDIFNLINNEYIPIHYRFYIPSVFIDKKHNSYTIIRILSKKKGNYEIRYTTSFYADRLTHGEKQYINYTGQCGPKISAKDCINNGF